MEVALKALPHGEAVAYFRSKGFAPSEDRFHHLDHFREAHARDWVVAKAMRDDVSEAIRAEMDRALAEGRTLRDFTAELAPRLQEMGWWGEQRVLDPKTGLETPAQLGSMKRLRTIFDTNMRTAHAAGFWARIQRTKTAFPYLEYVQVDRPSKRHDHTPYHGLIRPVDDPIWLRIFPPNGWFCGCHVIQRTAGWLKREGREVSPPFELDEKPWTNKRTGETIRLPKGVYPGFDTNPGATWLDTRAGWARMTPDLTPERRATERGLLDGARIRTLGIQREVAVLTDGGSEPIAMATAATPSPGKVEVPLDQAGQGASLLHSHLTDTPFSVEDLTVLSYLPRGSIVAVAPGGSLWRAVQVGQAPLRSLLAAFQAHAAAFWPQLKEIREGELLYRHAFLLFLERRGQISYGYEPSGRVRRLFERHEALIREMVDVRLPEA